jgi:hypothetical protein
MIDSLVSIPPLCSSSRALSLVSIPGCEEVNEMSFLYTAGMGLDAENPLEFERFRYPQDDEAFDNNMQSGAVEQNGSEALHERPQQQPQREQPQPRAHIRTSPLFIDLVLELLQVQAEEAGVSLDSLLVNKRARDIREMLSI